jgi:hypothetical protein
LSPTFRAASGLEKEWSFNLFVASRVILGGLLDRERGLEILSRSSPRIAFTNCPGRYWKKSGRLNLMLLTARVLWMSSMISA